MATTKLYLVRRESRDFIGPVTLSDLKKRLSRLEFGLQDEVSGHCGPWVILDHREVLTLHYPEVANLLGDALPLSWRETTGHAKVISKQDARKDSKSQSQRSSKSRGQSQQDLSNFLAREKAKNRGIMTASIVILLVAVIFGGVIVTKKEEIIATSDIAPLATKQDPADFLNVMGLKVIPFAGKIVKSGKLQSQWLPYLRMYAFYTTGSVDGVPNKLIRGDLPNYAPTDCTVDGFKKKWKENASQIVSFVQGQAIIKNPWTKLLAIDPNWVKRRNSKGWSRPRNFYEGCLMTASIALRAISQEPNYGTDPKDNLTAEIFNQIVRRNIAQLEILNLNRVQGLPDKNWILGRLTCFDAASSMADVEACKVGNDAVMQALIEERVPLSLVRVALNANGVVDARWLSAMQAVSGKIMGEDLMSRSDLGPENKFIGFLLAGSTLDQAVQRTEAEDPDLNLR